MPRGIGERDPITGRIVGRGNATENGDGSDGGAIDPESAAGTGEPDEPGARPRRKSRARAGGGDGGGGSSGTGTGTRKARKAPGASLDLSSFVGIWVGLHWQVARLTENPELQISENDAKEWLLRTQNVMRHYPLSASQKAIDWAAWTMVTSFMYVPRAAAIIARKNAQAAQPEAPSATVFQFNQKANGSGHAGNATDFASPPPIPPTVDGVVDEPELEPA
jgi:hypothetical protein